MSDFAFNRIMTEVDFFSYDQCVSLLSKLTQVFQSKKKEAVENVSPIDKFFGVIDESDSEKMLSAVEDCRRIEPNEW